MCPKEQQTSDNLIIKPGLHISRKDCKHFVPNAFLKLFNGLYTVVMIAAIHISQEIFAIDVLTTLKSSLGQRRKHILRLLKLYGDQTLTYDYTMRFIDYDSIRTL